MSDSIKNEFGKRFREARDAKKLSRAALGLRLGVSPKTIQSWEMGRTFIENLSLIPAIEDELEINIPEIIDRSVRRTGGASMAAEAPASYGARRKGRPQAGPISAQFDVHVLAGPAAPEAEDLAEGLVAIPVIKPRAAAKPVADLENKDIAGHAVIPSDWTPRGGVLVAFRQGDSSMAPMIPLGGTVIVDRRPCEMRQALNRVVALFIQNKGLRIRRLQEDPYSQKLMGMPILDGMRGKAPFRPDHGDEVLGRVVGVMAQPM